MHQNHEIAQILEALESVFDPEIPVLSVMDMGIITGIELEPNHAVTVKMTPTFVGCPAIDTMKKDIREKVESLGYEQVNVLVDLSIPWNSNRISESGKEKLKSFGLAPPKKHCGQISMEDLEQVVCPFCNSEHTSLKSPFGSTLCRTIHYCHNCLQSFEQFKPV